MIRNYKRVAILLVLSILTVISAIAAEPIETVKNGKTPAGKTVKLVLEEDWRLGVDDNAAFAWNPYGVTLSVDEQGNVYIVGIGENRVTVIDSQGKFSRFIGGPGQGPGEFRNLLSYQVLADGSAVALEQIGGAGIYHWFDEKGAFIKQERPGNPRQLFQNALFSPDGEQVFAQTLGPSPAGDQMRTAWIYQNLKTKNEDLIVGYNSILPSREMMTSPEAFSRFLGDVFRGPAQGNLGFGVFDDKGNFYSAVAGSYEVTRWDVQTGKKTIISREYDPIYQGEDDIQAVIEPVVESIRARVPDAARPIISEQNVRRAVELAEFPAVKLPIQGLTMLDNGILGVIHDFDMIEHKLTLDLFDKHGRFLGSSTLSAPENSSAYSLVFNNGYLYRIEADEDGEASFARYKYRLEPVAGQN